MVILYVCTGTKYSTWWVDNLKYMIKNQFNDDEVIDIQGIREGEGSVYDKLKLFKEFKDNEQYLYFDLDVVIRSDIRNLIKKDFTLLYAWWRMPAHTPLNSSIMSWYGDYSHIYDKFYQDEDYNRVKYWRGIDEFIFREIKYNIYEKVCWSYMFDKNEKSYPVCLFNQSYEHMRTTEWTKKYLINDSL